MADFCSLARLPAILDSQAVEAPLGAQLAVSAEWIAQKEKLELLLKQHTGASVVKALNVFAKIVDTLELYAPVLKGLQEVHAYVCDKLEGLVFDERFGENHLLAAAYIYGQAMAMSPLTTEAIGLAIENLLLRGDPRSSSLALAILLGVDRSNHLLFELKLSILLEQVQVLAFASRDKLVSRTALLRGMQLYSPERLSSQYVLQATHRLLRDSLSLCSDAMAMHEGVIWACFIIENMPMALRLDLRKSFSDTCDPIIIFDILQTTFEYVSSEAQVALCRALPILINWDSTRFDTDIQVDKVVYFMLGLPSNSRSEAMHGLGLLALTLLDRFEPFLDVVGPMALGVLNEHKRPKDQRAAQLLLNRLLAALGPIALSTMIEYLHCKPSILLADVALLEQIATLLPNLARKTIQIMTDIIDDLISGKPCSCQSLTHEAVLAALSVFPLGDAQLARRAQNLVIWSLDEEKDSNVVMAALPLVTDPNIAEPRVMRTLTFKTAQLLLADVHYALNVLSNPALASMLDERSCSMILLALHQSLEPSIQIVAAKLLTHLATAHRAIVQPLAWSHIRQSLGLMDFLTDVDPTRAIIEACIISNLLLALPQSLHQKYVEPVKTLILSGLHRPHEGHVLSLTFQGLANLAKVEGWASDQQSNLAIELLELSQEIPKDSQHAALNAISRLLSVPQEGIDVYNLLVAVHATFGGRHAKLDSELKALAAGIYGHLGTVERNPVISRDSRAAIKREESVYTTESVLQSQISEARDKYTAESQTHINWLVTKTLLSALGSNQKIVAKTGPSEEKLLTLEVATAFGILQPHAVSGLLPDLPAKILRELRMALEHARKDQGRKEAGKAVLHTPASTVGPLLVYFSGSLRTSRSWLLEYWGDMASVMAECICTGDALPVLKGLDVILDAITD
ncbi:hypothetical protein TREMEDRAFT_26582 [Tremella mesenterica DSM 1558]|uniref:uncharacterized protein n=1 Tax=Tremella mesenterica (strain ATCC 24925 / CBS 8224 / DSM 1558 / NBRC 9311 / NRRL Y-6157 / RJB 2259-6 / UBC 559-6) TaxID=578456 RepID=UPI0003F49CBF|nr:uncharacterized protein TREMEDRAFT_26582 [Tremella mesenterica DSM 1558]EIW72381.1 hypothetical protein TREMEDRAFT_26582 [Tremella mesenterica DSM 1558]